MTHYEEWTQIILDNKRQQTLASLIESATSALNHVLGQLEHGYYDSADIWGDYGYVVNLRLTQQVINEKRQKLNKQPLDFVSQVYK